MKTMIFGFTVAVAMAFGAYTVLNTVFQETAYDRFITTGAKLSPGEAGSNLVGSSWSGMGQPQAH